VEDEVTGVGRSKSTDITNVDNSIKKVYENETIVFTGVLYQQVVWAQNRKNTGCQF